MNTLDHRVAIRPSDAANHVAAKLYEMEAHSRHIAAQMILWRDAAHCWRRRYRSVCWYSVVTTSALAWSLIAHALR